MEGEGGWMRRRALGEGFPAANGGGVGGSRRPRGREEGEERKKRKKGVWNVVLAALCFHFHLCDLAGVMTDEDCSIS